jgi:predicted phosphoribosyltransferase
MMPERFRNRNEAGRLLAEKLTAYANRSDVLVLALPRGGVPVAYEVARRLGAPLDVFLVRKLGVPGYEELAMGAVATSGVRVLNDQIVNGLGIPSYVIDAVAAQEQQELERRERLYRGSRPPPDLRGRTLILVDDGLATGATMRAAVMALRQLQPARIVVATPTASPEICEELRSEVDEVICVSRRRPLVRGFLTDNRRRSPQSACPTGSWRRTTSARYDRRRTSRGSAERGPPADGQRWGL